MNKWIDQEIDLGVHTLPLTHLEAEAVVPNLWLKYLNLGRGPCADERLKMPTDKVVAEVPTDDRWVENH